MLRKYASVLSRVRNACLIGYLALSASLLTLSACATTEKESLHIQSRGHRWTVIPFSMPRGELNAILFKDEKDGLGNVDDALAAANTYASAYHPGCAADKPKQMSSSSGWITTLVCQAKNPK